MRRLSFASMFSGTGGGASSKGEKEKEKTAAKENTKASASNVTNEAQAAVAPKREPPKEPPTRWKVARDPKTGASPFWERRRRERERARALSGSPPRLLESLGAWVASRIM